MLVKVTDEFYIDLDQILLINKISKDIQIYVKFPTYNNQPFVISSLTKDGKEFIKQVHLYLGLPIKEKN